MRNERKGGFCLPMDGIEFAGRTRSQGLRMSAGCHAAHRPREGYQRQSGMLILLAALRSLPLSAPLSALLWWLIRLLVPQSVSLWPGGWFVTGLTVLLCVIYGVTVWLTWCWKLSGDRLYIRRGVISTCEISLRRCAVQSMERDRTPVCRLLGTAYLYFRTADRQPDRLLLSDSEAAALCARLMPSAAGHVHSYRDRSSSLWLASFGGDGLTAFVSAAAPVLSLAQEAAGTVLKDKFDSLAQNHGVLRAGIFTIAVIWTLKVLHTRLGIARMGHTVSDSRLLLSMGAIRHRIHSAAVGTICALDLRTTLFSSLLDLHSCSIVQPGGHRWTVLPAVNSRRMRMELASIARHGRRICTVQPVSAGLRYAAGRWLMCFSVLPMISFARRLLPSMGTTIPVIGLTAALLLVWRALITTVYAHRAGLAVFSDCLELTGAKWQSVHTLRVFRGSAAVVRIRQNPIARALGYCTLRIYPHGSRQSAVSCIKLPFLRTLTVCQRMM